MSVYTHGELLPAHGYPALKKRFPHLVRGRWIGQPDELRDEKRTEAGRRGCTLARLPPLRAPPLRPPALSTLPSTPPLSSAPHHHQVGNYGGAWYAQQREFAEFPGPILVRLSGWYHSSSFADVGVLPGVFPVLAWAARARPEPGSRRRPGGRSACRKRCPVDPQPYLMSTHPPSDDHQLHHRAQEDVRRPHLDHGRGAGGVQLLMSPGRAWRAPAGAVARSTQGVPPPGCALTSRSLSCSPLRRWAGRAWATSRASPARPRTTRPSSRRPRCAARLATCRGRRQGRGASACAASSCRPALLHPRFQPHAHA